MNEGQRPTRDDLEIDLEALTFKPVTRGLGFNQEAINPTPSQTASARPSFIRSNVNLVDPPLRSKEQIISDFANRAATNDNRSRDQLSSGRSRLATNTQTPSLSSQGLRQPMAQDLIPKAVPKTIDATIAEKGFAFVLDLGVVISIFTLAMLAVQYFSKIDLMIVIQSGKSLPVLVMIFSMFYMLYFTLMDLGTTVGKHVCGVQVQRDDRSSLSIADTFLRAFISLASFAVLGLPLYLNFHGYLTDTRVVKK